MWSGPGPWWPLLIVMPLVMVSAGVVMMLVMTGGRTRRAGWLCGFDGQRSSDETKGERPRPPEDPLVILRERFARGEIDMEEFEHRVDPLLRAEPEFLADRREFERRFDRLMRAVADGRRDDR